MTTNHSSWYISTPWIVGVVFSLIALALIIVPLGDNTELDLQIGDPAPFDIVAPRSQTYISTLQTESAQAAAENAVSRIYDPPDTRVSRQQISSAKAAIAFIDLTRSNKLATTHQKQQEFTKLGSVSMADDLQIKLIQIEDARWLVVQEEIIRVIENIMSEPIQEDQMEQIRQRIPVLISVELSIEEAELAAVLVQQFIVPNSLFNEVATNKARDASVDAVEPVEQAFAQGQTIIARGNVISAEDLEAMTALNMLEPQRSQFERYFPSFTAIVLVVSTMTLYLLRAQPGFFYRTKHMLFVVLLSLVFLFAAQFVIPQRLVLPFLFPAATLGMLIAVGLGTQLGLIVSTLFVVFIAIVSDGRIEIVIYHLVGPMVAILSLGKAERVNSFLLAGLATAAANSAVIIAFRFNDPTIDILGLSTLLGASIANGAISGALTLTGLFLLGYVFDITTSLQLVELSRPNHPLLVQLLRTAPGTYQHSLHVANLAEQAARNIGANTMLVRVSALFHDIGKTTKPEYFVENQVEGRNPHTNMDPQSSSNVIIAHVTDGDTMAKKHRLPTVIRDAILEHHGTTTTRYQYDNALKIAEENDEKVNISEYTYPGPKPQSPETALLMLADGCEAKAKADNPSTTEEIDKIVRFIINRRLKHGQLDDCDLSLTDLGKVRESFVTTLRGYYHNRLKYPPEPSVEEPLVEDLDQSIEIHDTKTSD
jgi:hypothetical protein